ncbi:Protein FAR-RED IMPAIRED RESPONSE 1 [Bienertia sinuspersici]
MEEGVGDGEGSSNKQMKATDGEDAVQDKAMDYDGVLGGDDAVDDVNGLDKLDVDQCVGDSNIGIRFGSGSGYNKCDNGTQREAGREMTNGDGVVTPRVGSVYSSWEEVERMFKEYGKKKGFGVIREQSAYYVGTKEKHAMTMRCECYGCPDMKLKSDEKKRLYASLNKEQLWEIRKVSLEHIGHKPEPGQAKLVKQNRIEHFTASMRSRVLNDIDAGVLLANIHGSIARERDGLQNMPIMEKDMRHVVEERTRLKMEGGDANALLKYFDRMQTDNDKFFHSFWVDEKGTLKDVFWADARSHAAYEEFGDVVCFDSTYLTNKYHLPFANFVGVNHHGQTVLFGCALVSVEDADTFEWVFRQWLKCMGGRAPDGILTDQAAAMRQPIKNVFPDTRNRWCIWNILRKLPHKLGRIEKYVLGVTKISILYAELKEELLEVVYDSFTKEEFDTRWEEVTSDYGIVNDEWLSGLFVERSMWVPTYMKDQFWVGMRTTQRVESINSFFDKFVTRQTRLCEFGEKYVAAVERWIMQEKEADDKGHKYTRNLLTGIPLEKYFQCTYTGAKFRAFQRECERLIYCYVKEKIAKGDQMVMDMNLYEEPPEKYVLRRWRKDIRRKHAVVEVCYHGPAKTKRAKRFDKMNAVFDALAYESCGCERTCDIVLKGLKRISDEVRSYNVVHVDEGGGMRGVGDINSVHSSEPIGSNTQRTAVSGTLHGEQTQAPAHPTDNSSANVVGQSEGSQPSVRIDIVAESGPGEQAATVVCGDPLIPKKKGRPKGTHYKSLGEKGWKKANENGSKNGGTGGKRKYQGDIAHMMAAASEKMKVTKNTNLSGNLAKAHAEQNMQHTKENRNCFRAVIHICLGEADLLMVHLCDLPRDFQFTHSCATADSLVIPDPIVFRSHQDIRQVVVLRRYGTPMAWHVSLHRIETESGMEFELVQGWADFMRENNVVNSDEVFFEYIGNSVFTVIVRDGHGVFKEVTPLHEGQTGQRVLRPRPYWNRHQDNCLAAQLYLENSQYPGFLVYMNRRYLSIGSVSILIQWVRANVPHDMMSGDFTVSLTYRGLWWGVKMKTYRKEGSPIIYKIKEGFRMFADDNLIEEGDVCCFEKTQTFPFQMKVWVFACDAGVVA